MSVMKRDKLGDAQIEAALASLAGFGGWSIEHGILAKEFRFTSYLDGMRFAARVAEAAEAMNHHPDLLISWRRVRFSVHTHSAGGLTELDFELAMRAEQAV